MQKMRTLFKNTFFRTLVTALALNYFFKLQLCGVLPLFLAILIYVFYKTNENLQLGSAAKWCGIVFALCLALGEPNLFLKTKRNALQILLILIGMSLFLQTLLQNFYDAYDRYMDKENISELLDRRASQFAFGILVICWLPYWLACYPAVLTPDSISQINQVLGLAPLVNHHPIAHTMLVKFMYALANFLGIKEINAVVGFISFMQILAMAACFALVVGLIYRNTHNKVLAYAAILYYGILSVHGYYSVTIWKDITFGMIAVLLIIVLSKALALSTDMVKDNPALYGSLLILSVAFCLFRSNGYYAMIIWLPLLALYSWKFQRHAIIGIVAGGIILSGIVKGPLYESFGIRETRFSEGLSIPLQQIAYVVKNNRPLNNEEKYLLGQIIEVGRIPKLYKPFISDPIKNNCRNAEYFRSHKWEYFKMWLKLGIRYPKDYVIAYLHQTRGYWYPNIRYWVYGNEVFKNDIGLKASPIAMRKAIEQMNLRKIFGSASFYNVAIYTWALLAMLFYVAAKKMWAAVICYSLLCGILISLLLGTPVFAEFRYYYAVCAALPLILALPSILKEKKEEA